MIATISTLAADLIPGGGALNTLLTSVLRIIGIGLVIYAAMKSVKDFAQGKVSSGVGRIVIFILLATFFIAPGTIPGTIEMFKGVVDGLFTGVSGVLGGGTSTP